MKLGGSIVSRFESAEQWGQNLERARFSAATCPIAYDAPDRVVADMLAEAVKRSVVIAEVGIWRNTLSPDRATREKALAFAKGQLAFADQIGAACCVNIAGSAGEVWDGAYTENYSSQTYDAIVRMIRDIIDTVRPKRTYFTIEPMPWMVPDGPDEYLKLLNDVDRERFAVHMDFVNMINSIKRSIFAEDFIEECFSKLSPWIKSCHIKDIIQENTFTTVIRETAPGKGKLDYERILLSIHKHLPDTIPVLLEHMSSDEEYALAYDYIVHIAKNAGVHYR